MIMTDYYVRLSGRIFLHLADFCEHNNKVIRMVDTIMHEVLLDDIWVVIQNDWSCVSVITKAEE